MSELPSWPDMNSFRNSNKYITRVAEIMYERARAEAALARLRQLVSALTAVTHAPVDYQAPKRLAALKQIASEALAAIGPLP